jgi:hypothetical protein
LDSSQLGSQSRLALFKESDWLAIDISLQRMGSAQLVVGRPAYLSRPRKARSITPNGFAGNVGRAMSRGMSLAWAVQPAKPYEYLELAHFDLAAPAGAILTCDWP